MWCMFYVYIKKVFILFSVFISLSKELMAVEFKIVVRILSLNFLKSL